MREVKEEFKELEKEIDRILEEARLTFVDRLMYLDGKSRHYTKQITPCIEIVSPEGYNNWL